MKTYVMKNIMKTGGQSICFVKTQEIFAATLRTAVKYVVMWEYLWRWSILLQCRKKKKPQQC